MLRGVIVRAACAALLALSATNSAAASITNGDFDQDLASGWSPSGDAFRLDDASGDHFAAFGEATPSGFSFVSQVVSFDAGDATISFDYALVTEGNFTGGALRDAFSVRFLDPITLDPLLATTGRSDIFYHEVPGIADPGNPDAGLILFDSALTTRDPLVGNSNRPGWSHVTIDTSSLSGLDVRLEFGLLRGDNGQTTFAALDNVIPEPTSLAGMLLAAGILVGGRRRS